MEKAWNERRVKKASNWIETSSFEKYGAYLETKLLVYISIILFTQKNSFFPFVTYIACGDPPQPLVSNFLLIRGGGGHIDYFRDTL